MAWFYGTVLVGYCSCKGRRRGSVSPGGGAVIAGGETTYTTIIAVEHEVIGSHRWDGVSVCVVGGGHFCFDQFSFSFGDISVIFPLFFTGVVSFRFLFFLLNSSLFILFYFLFRVTAVAMACSRNAETRNTPRGPTRGAGDAMNISSY